MRLGYAWAYILIVRIFWALAQSRHAKPGQWAGPTPTKTGLACHNPWRPVYIDRFLSSWGLRRGRLCITLVNPDGVSHTLGHVGCSPITSCLLTSSSSSRCPPLERRRSAPASPYTTGENLYLPHRPTPPRRPPSPPSPAPAEPPTTVTHEQWRSPAALPPRPLKPPPLSVGCCPKPTL
jgi:hypothetical protein